MSTSLSKHSFLCTIILVLAFSTSSQASRIDMQITTFMLNMGGEGFATKFIPGIGIGYDFRNPASRAGWSVVPSLFITTSVQKNSVASFLFPAIVGRYRYNFNQQLSMDANIGGGLLAVFDSYISHEDVDWRNRHFGDAKIKVAVRYLPAPFLSLGFNYNFTNQIMAGIDMVVLYSTSSDQVAPLLTIYTSFPIAGSERRPGRRR
jgi:hypothetical protein